MNMENKHYSVIIVGGGPSGIACADHLQKQGIDYVIIEQKDMLQTWKNERWDSFYLVTPNWMTNLPGVDQDLPYDNEYMTKDEIYTWLKKYMDHVAPNFVDHTKILRLYRDGKTYVANTDRGIFTADQVIVATGMFNQPFIPQVTTKIPASVNQIHSIDYFNPRQLVEGNTIVVGSGRSGVQIALEIRQELSSEVYLSVGSMTPLPTIYRNVNGVYWLNRLSGYTQGKEVLPYKDDDLHNENIVHKISQNLFNCQAEGVELTGRLVNAGDNFIEFSDSLCKALDQGTAYLRQVERQIDAVIETADLNLSERQVDFNLRTLNCHELDPIMLVDIQKKNIKNIVWCTGFRPHYEWLDLDIFDQSGMPILADGYSTKEDVYFCGMGLQPDPETKSSFGVGLFAFTESAERAVEALVRNRQSSR